MSFHTFVISAPTSSSITLFLTGVGLTVIPISVDKACGLTTSNKVIHEIVIQQYNMYKNQYKKDQRTIKTFDKLFTKYLQENLIDKARYESVPFVLIRF